jgi:hypothetical protein
MLTLVALCRDGVRRVLTAVEVDDPGAGLAGEGHAGGDVPGAVGERDAGVELALGQPGEIDRS